MHTHPKTGIAVVTKVRVVYACPLRPAARLCPGACISCPTFLFQGGRGTLHCGMEVTVLTCGQCPHNNYIFCKFTCASWGNPHRNFTTCTWELRSKYQQDLCLLSETCWTAPHHPMFWLLSSNLIRSKMSTTTTKNFGRTRVVCTWPRLRSGFDILLD